MNSSLPFAPSFQPLSRAARILLGMLAGALVLFASGCACPKTGPTDPKEFITNGRQWSNGDAPAASSAPAATP